MCIFFIIITLFIYVRTHNTITTAENRATAQQFGIKYGKITPLQPFSFDGCTLFPDTIGRLSFQSVCLTHDIAYWYGGSSEERLAADRKFKAAIADTGLIGSIVQYPMYWSVRLFGASVLLRPINANWGFGYNIDT